MDAGTPAALPPTAAPLRPLWARLLGIVTGPRAVFEELAQRPAWLGATLLLAAFSLVVSIGIYDDVILPTLLEKAEEQVTSSEQLAQAEEMYGSPAMKFVIAGFAAVGNFVYVLITGLLLTGACAFLLGAKTSWQQGVAVAAHAYLILIPRSLLALPIMFSRGTPEVSLGPGVFFPVSEAEGFAAKFLATLLGGFDLFNLWVLGLGSLGMAVVTRQPTARVARILVAGYLVIVVIWSVVGALSGG
jgi:hypothetical protein